MQGIVLQPNRQPTSRYHGNVFTVTVRMTLTRCFRMSSLLTMCSAHCSDVYFSLGDVYIAQVW